MGSVRATVAFVMVLMVAWPATAAAQSELVKDTTRDSVLIHFSHCDRSGFHCKRHRSTDQTNRTADVIWARHTYTRQTLTLTMKVRGMTRDKAFATYIGWEIDASKRQGWSTQLVYSAGHASFDLIPLKYGHTCTNAHAHVASQRHLYRLTLPTSCLGSSKWVRISESTMVQTRNGSRWWYDDPRQGADLKVLSGVAQEQLGPRLYRTRPAR